MRSPLVDAHYGLAGGELLGVAVGVVGEAEKISSSRCRKFAGRSTITDAGARGTACSGVGGGDAGSRGAQPQATSVSSSHIGVVLVLHLSHFFGMIDSSLCEFGFEI